MAQWLRIHLPMQETRPSDPRVRRVTSSRKWQPHSSILAGRVPRTEEPGGLQSTGSRDHKESHSLATKHALFSALTSLCCVACLLDIHLWTDTPVCSPAAHPTPPQARRLAATGLCSVSVSSLLFCRYARICHISDTRY